MKPKRIKYRTGDLFAVPVSERLHGLGHVVECTKYEATCALFAEHAATPAELVAKIDDTSKPVSILVVGDEYLKTGRWPILANCQRDYSAFKVPTHAKSSSYGQGWAEMFLAAYHGIDPWDGFDSTKHPQHHQILLIPGTRLPATVRYKKELTTDEIIAFRAKYAPEHHAPPPVTAGPALVTLQLIYPGTGLPSTDLLRRRQELERRLEAAGAGEIEGAESGGGVMEVFLRTDDVRRAVPLVEQLAAELGFADEMLIETAALEDDEDEDDEDDEP